MYANMEIGIDSPLVEQLFRCDLFSGRGIKIFKKHFHLGRPAHFLFKKNIWLGEGGVYGNRKSKKKKNHFSPVVGYKYVTTCFAAFCL